MSKRIALLFLFIAFVASAAQAPFAELHHAEVAKLTKETLVPILLDEDWRFAPVPEDGAWQNGPAHGTVFQLKEQQLNLDQLLPGQKKFKEQVILYNVFQAQSSGIAVLGAAADWWPLRYVSDDIRSDGVSLQRRYK